MAATGWSNQRHHQRQNHGHHREHDLQCSSLLPSCSSSSLPLRSASLMHRAQWEVVSIVLLLVLPTSNHHHHKPPFRCASSHSLQSQFALRCHSYLHAYVHIFAHTRVKLQQSHADRKSGQDLIKPKSYSWGFRIQDFGIQFLWV